MGTRSLTFIKGKEDKQASINIYKQFDGYPHAWGVQLSKYLMGLKLVSGFSLDQEHNTKVVNGVGCLIAKLISEFKTKTGGIYVYPIKAMDCGQEYEYHISVDDNGKIEIEIIEVGWGEPSEIIFKGSPTELINKYAISR